jgi:enoyl-CoA hydratase/carnithine racemase
MTEALIHSQADDVVTLTMNRPECLNALNERAIAALADGVRTVDSRVRAVVIRGAGRAFSSGYDLKEAFAASTAGPRSMEDAYASAEGIQSVTRALRACPAPVVAVVHGYAIGAGAELALSCDLVVAAHGTVFRFGETSVGLVVTNGVTHTLPRALGPWRAKELILLGEAFSAEDAHTWGLVNRLVDASELDAELASVLNTIRSRAPIAVRLAKALIDAGADGSLEQSLQAEAEAAVKAELTDDAREAARAFAEKRKPVFVGK